MKVDWYTCKTPSMIISMINGMVITIKVTAEYPYSTDDNEARSMLCSTHDGVPHKQGKKHKNPPTEVINRCVMVVVLKELPESIEDGINIDNQVVFSTFSSVVDVLSSSMLLRLV